MTRYIKITVSLFLLLVLGAEAATAQSVTGDRQLIQVIGRVLGENDEPLCGASVVQLGNPKNGAVTDLDGLFTLNIPAGTKIKVTYVGYEDAVVTASDTIVSTEITVRLKPSDNKKSGWIYLSMNSNPTDEAHMSAVNVYGTAARPPKEQ